MKVTPVCRYDHGPLARLVDHPPDHRFALMGITLPTTEGFAQVAEQVLPAKPSGRIYSLTVFRCMTCGYLELFDDESANG